jgi:thioesterase domain-containing protein
MMAKIQELENLLHDKIPMAKLMGTRILSIDGLRLNLALPLSINRNHKQTLFGGSLYSGSALACYGMFLWGLREAGITSEDIVIAEGNIKYAHPVDVDAEIIAEWPDIETRTAFFQTLQKKGKARIEMRANIITEKSICATFTGQFVAKIPQTRTL